LITLFLMAAVEKKQEQKAPKPLKGKTTKRERREAKEAAKGRSLPPENVPPVQAPLLDVYDKEPACLSETKAAKAKEQEPKPTHKRLTLKMFFNNPYPVHDAASDCYFDPEVRRAVYASAKFAPDHEKFERWCATTGAPMFAPGPRPEYVTFMAWAFLHSFSGGLYRALLQELWRRQALSGVVRNLR
jgi:hypothetical protein